MTEKLSWKKIAQLQEKKLRNQEKQLQAARDENIYLHDQILLKDAHISTVMWWRKNVCAAANTLLTFSQNRRILEENHLQVMPVLTDVSKTDEATLRKRVVEAEEKLQSATFISDNQALIRDYDEKLEKAENEIMRLIGIMKGGQEAQGTEVSIH